MPDLTVTAEPFEIALVGIDGAGKTAIAQKLAEDLQNRGLACGLANWRSLIRGGASDEPMRIVTEIHAASQRLWFVGAAFDDRKPLLPAETGALLRHLAGIMPTTVGWASNDYKNLFSSFLLELSSDIFS
ncbi:MAG: hypothetical protein HC869_00455 [Rhodospirillales bacterium]|nr:hypothetical protein [Rhodospirillales bacterium]